MLTDEIWRLLKDAADQWAISNRPFPQDAERETIVRKIVAEQIPRMPEAAIRFYASEFGDMVNARRLERLPDTAKDAG